MLQLQLVQQKIEKAFKGIIVEIIARNSRGDELKDIPLQTVEGSDFFTQDIFDALENGEADIAVHSLKDMSSEHFFGSNIFAVPDRDDNRDVAIFCSDIIQKIKAGKQIVIGTCSPRREEMAIDFLHKALPQMNNDFKITTKIIRGNVDNRLRKLDAGEYDGIILATAGLNRLLRSKEDNTVKQLLANKKLMLLPLIECVPAPCQGAIVAEANPNNEWAVEVINAIDNKELLTTCVTEKKIAIQYGVGCLQKFGVASFELGDNKFMYASGKNEDGKSFSNWSGFPDLDVTDKLIFNTADHMGSFFNYEFHSAMPVINEEVVYIANYKVVHNEQLSIALREKKVWASGTKTWYELARKGIWVEGCADAFGLETLEAVWKLPLINIAKNSVSILTNENAKINWENKGWRVYDTYRLINKDSETLASEIRQADIIFWTSFEQYKLYKNVLKKEVKHFCPYGETAILFLQAGIQPVIFPGIKAFQQWKQTFGLSRNAA